MRNDTMFLFRPHVQEMRLVSTMICMEVRVLENCAIQQKFRPMPMKVTGVSILRNYTWSKGFDRFINLTLH